MSSSTPESDIATMSYRFVVRWSIPVRELACIPNSFSVNAFSGSLRSNVYRFRNIKNLEFSYILWCGNSYKMECKHYPFPVVQEDALILINDRIYRLPCNSTNTVGRLVFDRDVLDQNSFEDDKVTLHCVMSIPARVEVVNGSDVPLQTAYSKGDGNVDIVEYETLVSHVYLDPHGYDAVNEFVYSGRIPDFSVEMAVSMMAQAQMRQNPMLKALCSEYLMENITTENVAQILTQSLASEAMDLSQKCADFLSKYCRIASR